jgi:hypothetical protein
VANVIVPYSGDVFLPTTRCEPRTASALRKTHTGLYHPRKTDHGPFDFYECANGASGGRFPLPSTESLKALYKSFSNGLNPETVRR